MIPTKSKTWETALSIGLLAAFKSSWSRWSLGLRLRHWPFVQFDSGLSCFVCVLIIYYSNELGTSSVVYWLDLCTDLNVICLARYFWTFGDLRCRIWAIIQILISPNQYFYSKCYWRYAIFYSNLENKLSFKTATKISVSQSVGDERKWCRPEIGNVSTEIGITTTFITMSIPNHNYRFITFFIMAVVSQDVNFKRQDSP